MDSISPDSGNNSADLTLEKVVAAVLEHNPDLNVSKFNTQLAEAEKLQASFFPNPELELEYENFDEPEKTLAIGYLIELGGKRKQRMELAGTAVELATIEFDGARVELIYETAAAFINVLLAQENLRITMEKEKLADQVYATSRERVLAGRVSPMEQVTAEIKRSNVRIEVQKADDELMIARTNLSSMWGNPGADFNVAKGSFEQIRSVPSFDSLSAAVQNSPVIRAKSSEIKIAENSLDLEKRNRIPDLTLSGGIKKIDESDDLIYIVGLSLPIPLFDHNQAAVKHASSELDRHAAALFAEKNRLIKDLKIAYQTLKTAHQQVNTIKTDILPSAQTVLEAVKEGYQEGEFGFLEMLEAQSTLYESHESYVQSLGQYHHAVIDLEKILGKDLSEFN
ncbi:MAG: TolC family protein [Desulfobacteraceae bacterium]|nr:TolC family protein [Desulfobacteraceae bacterium]MBC2755964.1 TolC family protein [Desulfobacteraceae bacterium]